MPTDDQSDDPRVQRDDAGIRWNQAVAEERAKLRSDGGDPVAALRAHFDENSRRLSQQIEQAEGELRSLQMQQRAFVAALQALDGPKTEAIITPEH